jgi:hypothetical protein
MFGSIVYPGGARRARSPGRSGGTAATRAIARVLSQFDHSAPPAERLEGRWLLATFSVTTAADAGPGSLRQAILDANAAPGADLIGFAIPGPAGTVHTIRPLSPLPAVTGPTTLDAASQPGYDGSPVVELDGSSAGPSADGLTLASDRDNTFVRGFTINRFGGNGIVAAGRLDSRFGTPATTLRANRIGTNSVGDAALPNGAAGILVTGPWVHVSASVVSGNLGPGIRAGRPENTVPGTYRNLIIGDTRIGTNAAGTAALGNGGEGVLFDGELLSPHAQLTACVISGNGASGVRVSVGSDDPTAFVDVRSCKVGTDVSGSRTIPNGVNAASPHRDGITATRGTVYVTNSVVSGNFGSGVSTRSPAVTGVAGCRIGTDATGTYAVGNRLDGVRALGAIGSLKDNLISGNGFNGVSLSSVVGAPVFYVYGNRVGTNLAGTAAVPNGGAGFVLQHSRNISFQSPPSPWPEVDPPVNYVSGNRGPGIAIVGDTTRGERPDLPLNIVITRTVVGLGRQGGPALGNGGDGIGIAGVRGVTITGATISANGGSGVLVTSIGPRQASDIVIESSTIGGGASHLGNHGHGVEITNAFNVRVGGERPGGGDGGGPTSTGNFIAYNGGDGVSVRSWFTPSHGHLISRNRIQDNGGLGIDLVGGSLGGPTTEGVTPNDPLDADLGPNDLQNFPTITEAVVPGDVNPNGQASLTVRFTLHSAPNQQYRVELFSSERPDPSGHGEGSTFLAAVLVTTDAAGNAAGEATVFTRVPAFVTATAIRGTNTSEFSPAVRAFPALPAVVGRRVFYNNSAFDGRDPAANAADDAAVATDVTPLLPGQYLATINTNLTNYSRGLNGVMVDLANAYPRGAAPVLDDFEFRAGNSQDPSTWAAAPPPAQANLRRGAGVGGSDRVTFTWNDGAVRNSWLQVTVKSNARTGLARPDVFYFGNLVGETGLRPSDFAVTPTDYARARAAVGRSPVTVEDPCDVNRDGRVSPIDVALVRANLTRSIVNLRPPPAATPLDLEAARDEEEPVFA